MWRAIVIATDNRRKHGEHNAHTRGESCLVLRLPMSVRVRAIW